MTDVKDKTWFCTCRQKVVVIADRRYLDQYVVQHHAGPEGASCSDSGWRGSFDEFIKHFGRQEGRAYGIGYTTKQLFVGIEPKGFRDLYWCAHQNEPVLVYGDKKCRECSSSIDDEDGHTFLGHVMKP